MRGAAGLLVGHFIDPQHVRSGAVAGDRLGAAAAGEDLGRGGAALAAIPRAVGFGGASDAPVGVEPPLVAEAVEEFGSEASFGVRL